VPHRSSFVVVANRLPVDSEVYPDGQIEWRRSPGGLVTALEPVMRRNDGIWVGWPGAPDVELPDEVEVDGLRLKPIPLSSLDVERYYEGFSNDALWPLYHDVVAPPTYHRSWWESYVAVNRRFAEAAAAEAADNAVVWVQDYQLQLVPAMLRERRPDLRIGFFLHIPFPPQELFSQLPWRARIVEGLLGADLVGFQRPMGAQNFLRLCRSYLGLRPQGSTVEYLGRTVRAASFPISIDFAGLDALATTEGVQKRAKAIRAELGEPRTILLGVDRLDYTKGIDIRLRAIRELLEDGAIDPRQTVMVQVATPSRERVVHYRRLRDQIERDVGRINGDYGQMGHPAVHYLHQSHSKAELAAMYVAADVMVVTPLRDGMNLVAKEYVACRRDLGGALVLSEFAGAAAELKQAYLVNPHDIVGLKESLLAAIRQDPRDGARRMRGMRRYVAAHDVEHWANTFLSTLRAG
jgi:trehalose 6-phosphate synthase